MPIMQEQNVFTQRIYHGDVEIKRVYLGDDLMWGLYNITYHLAGGTQPNGVINEYVWGIADIDLPKPTWQGQSFFTKFNGWWEGNTYVTAVPAITKDLHEDLELYAKWTQRKYTYSGTYTYSEQVWVGGGGGGDEGVNSAPSFSSMGYGQGLDNYFWGGSNIYAFSGNYMANCTTYAYGRALYAGLGGPTSGVHGAGAWLSYPGDGWDPIPGYDWHDVQPGDIMVSSNHVSFVENDGYCSGSWYTRGGTNYGHRTSPEDASSYYWGGGGGSAAQNQFYHVVSVSNEVSSGHHGSINGILRPSGGGGGGHWETETYNVNVAETDSGINQKSPQRPSAPKGSWSQFNEYTYERNYPYNTNGSGEWREDWNQVSTSWLPSSQSDGWY